MVASYSHIISEMLKYLIISRLKYNNNSFMDDNRSKSIIETLYSKA